MSDGTFFLLPDVEVQQIITALRAAADYLFGLGELQHGQVISDQANNLEEKFTAPQHSFTLSFPRVDGL